MMKKSFRRYERPTLRGATLLLTIGCCLPPGASGFASEPHGGPAGQGQAGETDNPSYALSAVAEGKPPRPRPPAKNAEQTTVDPPQVESKRPESYARSLSTAFRNAAQTARPSVVTILTRARRPGEESSVLDIIGGPDEQIFDSVGSGVIIAENGLVLTNHHVIQDAFRIEVRLVDGRQFTTTETLSDENNDVAILRIENEEAFPAAELGSSENLDVGDWVLAIGSPFTLETSVSAGIISGKRRRQRLSRQVSGQFLQTDAAINPGNSGGPLIDLDGRVVGISTAISSRSGGFQGIGFAIPIDRAEWIKNELLEYGRVRRGYAGVRTSDVPYNLARQLALPRTAGALVNAVVPDYPADKAGLKSGDVILEFENQVIESASDLAEMIQQSRIGESLDLTVNRDGTRIELQIELEERR